MGDNLQADLFLYNGDEYRSYRTTRFTVIPRVGEVYYHDNTFWNEEQTERVRTRRAFLVVMVMTKDDEDQTRNCYFQKTYKVYMREIKLPIAIGSDGPEFSFVIEDTPTAASVTKLPRS